MIRVHRAAETRPMNILVTNDGADKYSFRLSIGPCSESGRGSDRQWKEQIRAYGTKHDGVQMQRGMKHN